MVAANPTADFNLSAIPKGREEIARKIVQAFANANLGEMQQLAALANAIAESELNPNATSAPPDQSVGLFQLNRTSGLGKGHTEAELKDPATNINIILSQAKKFDDFAKAASFEEAVSIFTRKVMRPRDMEAQVIARLRILQRLREKS
jgi:hypothetical protein